ncbi:uncharacterized protein G2W53_005289 [Senna tora]|uniref:Uncharacterized protein n=1 Tax=Senna tora TaxID=362788 RepID=A0A834XFG6_9FABA|nr:uncharacterized protein G2W53_005289 [Senna tora]
MEALIVYFQLPDVAFLVFQSIKALDMHESEPKKVDF